MKYGIREICDVVLRAKSNQKIGNKVFYKDEPVCYFDSLKTSSLEGAATTVYAQGGRGNSRLIAWEGERTVTFTMEDALISTEGLALLTGAGIVEPSMKEQKEYLYETCINTTGGSNTDATFGAAPLLEENALQIYDDDGYAVEKYDPNKSYTYDFSEILVQLYRVASESHESGYVGEGTIDYTQPEYSICHLNEITSHVEFYNTAISSLYPPSGGVSIYTIGEVGINLDALKEKIPISVDSDFFQRDIYIDDDSNYGSYLCFNSLDETYAVALRNVPNIVYSIIVKASTIPVHTTEVTDKIEKTATSITITPSKNLSAESNAGIYIMPLLNGNVFTEPYIGKAVEGTIVISSDNNYKADLTPFEKSDSVLLDYYTDKDFGVQQIEITPDKFGGNYYLEASTLFRDTNGVDMPAEFIIPNCKIQSNFTFSMASSGDPSTFTFTMDAFPDYTRFDKTKKVLSVIQVITDSDDDKSKVRKSTDDSLSRV